MIPRLDITKVIAKEVIKNNTKLILTFMGAFFKNFRKSIFTIFKNRSKYTKFSADTIIPKMLGESKKRGLNQKVKNFSGREYPAIFTPEPALFRSLDLFEANFIKSPSKSVELFKCTTAKILS